MPLPERLLKDLQRNPKFDHKSFVNVHDEGNPPVSIRRNPRKHEASSIVYSHIRESVPWCKSGFFLNVRPQFALDPLWHAGCYYVQEASSMIIEAAWDMFCASGQRKKVLDLCAAPGGKSTHLLTLLQDDDVLVSNEVIRSRVPVLQENITRWGNANVIVTNNDPADFGALHSFFDVMLVDAPCSGSGLFRRDAAAIGHWSPEAVTTCSLRQKRILADALPSLRTGGILIYATCSFSWEEDEAVAEWLTENFSLEHLPLELPLSWHWQNGWLSEKSLGHRAFPHLLQGEGFYIAVFRKKNEDSNVKIQAGKKFQTATSLKNRPPNEGFDAVVSQASGSWFENQGKWWFMPEHCAETYLNIRQALSVKKAGVLVGSSFQGKGAWQPHHEMSLSLIVNTQLPKVNMDESTALQFLKGNAIDAVEAQKGYVLCSYKNQPLGWGKNIGTRVNNLLPKEWRLRKMS